MKPDAEAAMKSRLIKSTSPTSPEERLEKPRTITSFGSAFISKDEKLYSEIISIGRKLAEAGYTVISGGYGGSMEAISKGAFEAGGNTIGIGVKNNKSSPNPYLSDFVLSENLMERILTLIQRSDSYIVFKGGTGTLVELSVSLEFMNKNYMSPKKMIFYKDHWKSTIETLMNDSPELNSLISGQIYFINSPEELAEFI